MAFSILTPVYIDQFVVISDTDYTNAWNAAIAFMDARGGGELWLDDHVYNTTSSFVIGNGTATTASTSGNNISIKGAGKNSILRYTGSSGSGNSVLDIEGPIQNLRFSNFTVDPNGINDYGVFNCHSNKVVWDNIEVVNHKVWAWHNTTRPQSIASIVSYGCGDQEYINLNIRAPNTSDAKGIRFTTGWYDNHSGIFFDTCKHHIRGGEIQYGGNAGTYGAYFSGADNCYIEDVDYGQRGSSTGLGWDQYLDTWGPTTATIFPNAINLARTSGGSKHVGTSGALLGRNFVGPMGLIDGQNINKDIGMTVLTQSGQLWVDGVQKV